MATSKLARTARLIAGTTVALALAVLAALVAGGSSQARVADGGARSARAQPAGGFGWLAPAPPPAGWLRLTTASSQATLSYPAGWRPIPGDKGTVTVALRDRGGLYLGYLNVTPRQGAEQLHGWAAFRTHHNREDGDHRVAQRAAAEGLGFRDARGSCVIDDYLSKVGSHAYREIACIVSGSRHADIFIGAALISHWRMLGGTVERAASSFLQR